MSNNTENTWVLTEYTFGDMGQSFDDDRIVIEFPQKPTIEQLQEFTTELSSEDSLQDLFDGKKVFTKGRWSFYRLREKIIETPAHYKGTAIIEFCEESGVSFSVGNFIKYILRYKQKNGIDDLKKALFYSDYLNTIRYSHQDNYFLKKLKDLLNTYNACEFQTKVIDEICNGMDDEVKRLIQEEIARLEACQCPSQS